MKSIRFHILKLKNLIEVDNFVYFDLGHYILGYRSFGQPKNSPKFL